jgi:transketolase
MMTDDEIRELRTVAAQMRVNILRMIQAAGSGHPGGSLSAIDIVAYLYFRHMRIEPARPKWEERDRFVLSKGHCAPALYAALAARGYFPEEVLWTLRDIGSLLQGHPDMKGAPGIDMTSGSLGQGFSAGTGIALGGKYQGKSFRVYVMVSDGEIEEGLVWEAAMAGAHYKLDNLVAIVDANRQQSDGWISEIMTIERIEDKWRAFGWEVLRIEGHDFRQIEEAFKWAMPQNGKPHVIIANTVKGKGVAEMEDNPAWHSRSMTAEMLETYTQEILSGVTS